MSEVEHATQWPGTGLAGRLNRIGMAAMSRLRWPHKLTARESRLLWRALNPDDGSSEDERTTAGLEAAYKLLVGRQMQVGSSEAETIMGVALVKRALASGVDELGLSVALSLGMTAVGMERDDVERDFRSYMADIERKLAPVVKAKRGRAEHAKAVNAARVEWHGPALAKARELRSRHPTKFPPWIAEQIHMDPAISSPSQEAVLAFLRAATGRGELPKRSSANVGSSSGN